MLLQGIGEPPVFLASTIFFAIKEAVAAARRERGLGDSFPLSSPATAERIRMACEDQFTEMVIFLHIKGLFFQRTQIKLSSRLKSCLMKMLH